MRAITLWCGAVALILSLFCGNAFAYDDEFSRPTLKGLKGVHVLVESLKEDIVKAGLNKETIQTDVELKLRLAGIPVLTREECVEEPGSPYLYVIAGVLKSELCGYIVKLDVEVKQEVRLVRSPAIQKDAATWSVGGFGRTSDLKGIRECIKDQVDIFINAYLSVNPKK